jgi:hypothetical protein
MLHDVTITVVIAPLNAARTAQRAIPTWWWHREHPHLAKMLFIR